ncbi:hypothetical protein [Undibacterium sp. Ji22W]|uniref:hypothetical protein n=1 Tax=Undibacterium sp. Ji22W TaxID=3413038 RepID=UPI003BF2F854
MTVNALTVFPSSLRPTTFAPEMDQHLSELELFQQQLNEQGNAFALGVASISSSSIAMALGIVNLTVEPEKGYIPGMDVVVAYTATPTMRMLGTVFSYDIVTGALAVDVYSKSGSGTYTDWSISMTSAVDAAAFVTPTGTQTLTNKTLTSPVMNGNPTAPTPGAGDNTASVATTAHVYAERSNAYTMTNKTINWSNNTMALTSGQLLAALANKTGTSLAVFSDSPTLTGTPIVPTASPGTNTTQMASCAFVMAALGGYAPIASPSFTGVPLAPTAVLDTNTTQIASTAFVLNQFANGTLAAGRYKFTASGAIAKGDIVALNSNGTVSPIASLFSAGSIGAKAAYNAVNPTTILQIVNVPGTDKVIILYNENGTIKLFAGTAVGATTNTFTIGTPITAPTNTSITSFSMTWNVTEGVLVLTYINTTMYAVTVSLSGTTLTANIPNNSTLTPNLGYTCCEYNTVQNKTVVAYTTAGSQWALSLTISGASYAWGTALQLSAIAGNYLPTGGVQLAGTSIVAFGFSPGGSTTPYVYLVSINAGTCALVQAYAATTYFGTSVQTIKLGYHQTAGFLFVGSSLGTAFTGKTSGATMTNLASATFSSMTKIHGFSYDTAKNALIVTGADVNGYAVAANLSIVANASVTTNYTTINGTSSNSVIGAYNAAQDRMVIAFMDIGNLNYGTTRVWQTGASSADQWIGIAQAAISNAAAGWIWTIGGYCDAYTGLTVGTTYYVDDSGALQTTGNRKIGVALATNLLFLKGNA